MYVLPGTGVAVKGRFQATGLSFNATLGPFSVVAGKNARLLSDNGTPSDPTDDTYDGNGVVKLGADLTIGQAIADPVAIGDFISNLSTYLTPSFTAGPDQDCGLVTPARRRPGGYRRHGGGAQRQVLGCGLLSIGIAAGSVTNYVADLGIVELSGGQFTVTPAIPTTCLDSLQRHSTAPYLAALPKLIDQVKMPCAPAARRQRQAAADRRRSRRRRRCGPEMQDTHAQHDWPTSADSPIPTSPEGRLAEPGVRQSRSSGLLMKPTMAAPRDGGDRHRCDHRLQWLCAGKGMGDLKDVRVIFGISPTSSTPTCRSISVSTAYHCNPSAAFIPP